MCTSSSRSYRCDDIEIDGQKDREEEYPGDNEEKGCVCERNLILYIVQALRHHRFVSPSQ